MNTQIFTSMLALATASFAGNVALTGTVIDEAKVGVANVAVVLGGTTDTAWTNASGAFALTTTQSDAIGTQNTVNLRLQRNGRSITLLGAVPGMQYTLDAYLPNGKALVKGLALQDGRVQLPQGAYQTLFLKLRSHGSLVATWNGIGVSAARSASIAGILTFAKAGYLPDTLGLSSLSATALSKTLLLSDPWIPSGSLEHSGNQVRVLAKGKSFAMGSNIETLDYTFIPENARHSVSFTNDFWMDTTEVTQKLYDSVMTNAYGAQYGVKTFWSSEYGLGDNYPAYSIHTAGGAMLFANGRSKLAGLDTVYTYTSHDGVGGSAILAGVTCDLTKNGYRLPTEAEWEYATRAGTVTEYFWGTDSAATQLDKYAVWAGNSFDKGLGAEGFGTHPVASKLPNAYGLYDLQGNVSEWTNDRSDFNGYASGAVTDPTGTATGDWLIRGSNWGGTGIHLRASNRTLYTPAYSFYFEGMRTVRTAK